MLYFMKIYYGEKNKEYNTEVVVEPQQYQKNLMWCSREKGVEREEATTGTEFTLISTLSIRLFSDQHLTLFFRAHSSSFLFSSSSSSFSQSSRNKSIYRRSRKDTANNGISCSITSSRYCTLRKGKKSGEKKEGWVCTQRIPFSFYKTGDARTHVNVWYILYHTQIFISPHLTK